MNLSCSKKCDEAITNIVLTAIMNTIPLFYETALFTKSDMPSLNVIH